MTLLSFESLSAYWSAPIVEANVIIFFNLLGALLLGLVVGYERSYHGRAAGMRTYSLVCLASAALTVIVGYPNMWFGGHAQVAAQTMVLSNPDVTRVIQGIVTGVGFLGAGVIIKEGFTISGLTTAASIWTASAIGVLVGVGFYAAATSLAVMSPPVMMWVSKLEMWLPSRHAIAIDLHFTQGFMPSEDELSRSMQDIGYEIAKGSLVIDSHSGKQRWHFAAIALLKNSNLSIPTISQKIAVFNGVEDFQLAFARN